MDRRDLESIWVDSNVSTRRNSTDSLHAIMFPPFRNDLKNERTNSPNPTRFDGVTPADVEKGRLDSPANRDDNVDNKNRVGIPVRERLHHFTWAWFTLPMSSGGLALLIHEQPHQCPGLHTIGLVVYALNVAIFAASCLAMTCRFVLYPCDIVRSVTHPREGFFFPTFFLAIATLITTTQRYLIPEDWTKCIWATQTIFWAYLVVTLILAVAQYSYLFAAHSFNLQTMMPSWILPIFPVMLTGTVSSVILDTQSNIQPIPLIVAGLTCQGLGFSVAIMMYAHMIGRLMQSGLPNREHRPALFINVGPPAFTALALIGLSDRLPTTVLGANQPGIDIASVRAVALMAAVFLWALSFWWFCISSIAVMASPPKQFHLCWWPMVFPNTGFTLATIYIGQAFQSEAVQWVSTGMSIIVLIAFCIIFCFNVRAVIAQEIMYPGRDEDADAH